MKLITATLLLAASALVCAKDSYNTNNGGCEYNGAWSSHSEWYTGPTHSCQCWHGDWRDCTPIVKQHNNYKVQVAPARCEYQGVWHDHGEWYQANVQECQCWHGDWRDCKDIHQRNESDCRSEEPTCYKDTLTLYKQKSKRVCKNDYSGYGEEDCETQWYEEPYHVELAKCECGWERHEEQRCDTQYKQVAVTRTKTIHEVKCFTDYVDKKVPQQKKKCETVWKKVPKQECKKVKVPTHHKNKHDKKRGKGGYKWEKKCHTVYVKKAQQVCKYVDVYGYDRVPVEVCKEVPKHVDYVEYVEEPYQNCHYQCVETPHCPCSDSGHKCSSDYDCGSGQLCDAHYGVCKCATHEYNNWGY